MIQTITFNQQQAKKADAPRSITQSGLYTGVITQAEMYESKNGATMFEMAFKATDGSVTFIGMCLASSDGKETFSMGILQAMMGILGIESINAVAGKVFNRDGTTREGYRVHDLEKKRIGILAQRENDIYEAKDGSMKESFRINCVTVFDPETKQTYHEKAAGAPAVNVEKRLEKLADKDSNRLKEFKEKAASPKASAEPFPDDDDVFF